MRATSGAAILSRFQEVETVTPVILTTSQMLTTGVDTPTARTSCSPAIINSMTEFKQIIGRGTRVREDYGKLFFTILDYTGARHGTSPTPTSTVSRARHLEKMADRGEAETTTDVEEPLGRSGRRGRDAS